MLHQPKESVTFTDEQTKQLSELSQRVEAYHLETRLENQKLESLKADSATRQAHLSYLTELESAAEKRLVVLTNTETTLRVSLAQSTEQLRKNTQEIQAQHILWAQREEKLAAQEKEYASRAQALTEQERTCQEKKQEIAAEKVQLEKAKEILCDALKKLQWK